MKKSDLLLLATLVFVAPHMSPWLAVLMAFVCFMVAVGFGISGD